jgi:hypothetical protein
MQTARNQHFLPETSTPEQARTRLARREDRRGRSSPAQELQVLLRGDYEAPAPEPEVGRWPAWARLAVLAAGAALTWGVVLGVALLLLDS